MHRNALDQTERPQTSHSATLLALSSFVAMDAFASDEARRFRERILFLHSEHTCLSMSTIKS